MPSEFENIYYAISKNGYVLINDNQYDYSQDTLVIDLIKKYKKLVLGDSFNQSIDFLPDGVTHLQLGRRFNKPIMNLPRTLKHLIIAANEIAYCDFNQSLDNLPEGLEFLTIRLNQVFNMPINNLPLGLKLLEFICKGFRHPINNLPDGLEGISISCFDYDNTHHLPANLKQFDIHNKLSEDEKAVLNKNLINVYPNIQFEMNY